MKYFLLAISMVSFLAFGQTSKPQEGDTKSQGILDKFSTKVKGLTSFYVEFSTSTKSAASGVNSSSSGKGWVKGEKYYAALGDVTVISNGKKNWSIVKEDKSVYESDASSNDNVNPKKLLTMWEKGFKNKYEKEESLNGETCHVINLYPMNPAKTDFHTITVYISKSDNNLKKSIMKRKNGTVDTYTLTKFTENPTIEDSKFVFNAKSYPGYTVVAD